jgi:hypothetical protein
MATTDIARLERKIDKLIEKAYRPLWVKARVITGLTAWNNEKMRQARENGYVEYEERKEGDKKVFWYNLNSLDSRFIKQSA